MKDMQRCSALCGQIAEQLKELQTAIGQICNEQPKPLLADAKVGDWAEKRNGKFVKIVDINNNAHYSVFYDDAQTTTIDGKHCKDDICRNDIIRLIPTGSKEWQELENKDLLSRYPNIERDLSTVQKGDTVLMDNGQEYLIDCLWSNSNHSGFDIKGGIKYDEQGIKSYYCSSWLYNGKASAERCNITCLGIIKRAKPKTYTFTEAFDILDSGEVKGITRLAYDDDSYIVKPGNDDEDYCWNDGKEWSMSPADRKATDWVVVR